MKHLKYTYCTIFIVLIFAGLIYGENRNRLSGLVRPESLAVDAGKIYVSDGAAVHIYSRDDYALITRFGRKGNGPQEFALFSDRGIRIHLTDDKILVNSVMKLSFWTKQGTFIKSIKPEKFSAIYLPIGKNYVGSGRVTDKKFRYKTVNLYDAALEPFKEIMRSKEAFQPGRGLSIGVGNNYIFEVGDGRIFCCNSNDFEINIFNDRGEKIKNIRMDFKGKKVTADDKEKINHYLKTDPKFKDIYHMLKPLTFGDYFPAIDGLKYNDGKLFVISGSGKKAREIILLRADGTFIKRLEVSLKYKNSLNHLYPYVIEKGKIFQLVEDADDEEWDLLIFDLDL